MKHKTIGIVSLLFCLAAILFVSTNVDKTKTRYHQHLERPGYTACTDHGSEKFCTHLPIVMIDTGGKDIPGVPLWDEDYHYFTRAEDGSRTLHCNISVVDNEKGNNHLDDEPDMTTEAEIRIRGNTSRHVDKRGYLINAKTDGSRVENRSVPMLGMSAHHEWALHAPYHDKSLIRNYLCFNLAGSILSYAPEVRYCEVFINGEYQGLYLMMETITRGKGCRVNISKPEETMNQTSYIVRVDRGSRTDIKNIRTFTNYTFRNINKKNIVYPGAGTLTEEKARFIEKDFSDFEKALYSYDYDSYRYGWRSRINDDSFADYYLLHEFTGNFDVGSFSTYIYRDISGRYQVVPWDFDGALGNLQFNPAQGELESYDIIWFNMLFRDEKFTEKVLNHYWKFRKTYFSDEWLDEYIDSTVEWLEPAAKRDAELWGERFKTYRPLLPENRNPDDYEEAVKQVKDYIHIRGQWLDQNIEVLRQYCADSRIKKYIEDAN